MRRSLMLVRPALKEYRTWTTDSRRWSNYLPRPDDIIVGTAPKCGTTWTQQIVSSLIFQDAHPRSIPDVSPWIDRRFAGPVSDTYAALETQPHRRFIKTHLPLDGVPLYDNVRYIHVARDGRDAVMSMHNHFSGYSEANRQNLDRIGLEDPVIAKPYPRIENSPAEFFRRWISTPVIPGESDGSPTISFFDLEVSYWSERRRRNVLLVHYNDLKADLDGEMRRISTFLGISINQDAWPSLVNAATFETMRAAGDELMPLLRKTLADGANRFFHKGTSGRWRDQLTGSDLALYDAKVRQKFSPQLAAWIEGGRLAAGDPAAT
jgi:aryl sulfotransferase